MVFFQEEGAQDDLILEIVIEPVYHYRNVAPTCNTHAYQYDAEHTLCHPYTHHILNTVGSSPLDKRGY